MEGSDVKRLALIFAIQAEIEGMKAFNTERENNGEALGYDESAFNQAAEELRNIAYCHEDQLFD